MTVLSIDPRETDGNTLRSAVKMAGAGKVLRRSSTHDAIKQTVLRSQ